MRYLPFILIAAAFGVLFLSSRGLFRASAAYLLRRFPALAPYAAKETLAVSLLILFAANLIGAVLSAKSAASDTAAQGYLVRNEYGSSDEDAALTVELDGDMQEIDLTLAARKLKEEEIDAFLTQAAERLPALIFRDTLPAHVDRDLPLPSSVSGLPVKISWESSDPSVIDWDGLLTGDAPESGAPVTLTAELVLEEHVREVTFAITVFPRAVTAEEALSREIREAVRDANKDTDTTVYLPDTIGTRRAVWSLRQGDTGAAFLLIGMLAAVLYVYAKIRAKERAEELRDEEMLIDYPNIVSKLVLLIAAGMSLRKAFARIRADYRENLAHGGGVRPGYEEIVKMSLEMEHGISEITAYENLGKRSRLPAYRTFSTLLVQNLMKGGSEMMLVLKREADEAFEERKKRARILGEEAGTKLLLPMLLMLVIVMVILMVPAFFAFF